MDKNLYIPNTHILWVEYRCRCCGQLPPDFYITPNFYESENEKPINPKYVLLFDAFEWIRSECGFPIGISRGYSCISHQLFLFLNNIRNKYGSSLSGETIIKIINDPVLTPFSEHVFGFALDMKPKPEKYDKVLEAAKRHRPKLRIGWKGYNKTLLHIGIGYEIDPRYSVKLRKGAEW